MFCKKCGRQLEEGESYCPICGTVNNPEVSQNPSNPFYGEPDDQVKNDMAGQVLKWGILSLAFGVSGCLSLLGFIFSFTARRKAREYVRLFGQLEGRARVGNILGWVGFGTGLGYTIFFGIYFTILALLMMIGISMG